MTTPSTPTDQLATTIARAHIAITQFAVAIREAVEDIAAALQKAGAAMHDAFKTLQILMRRRLRWLDRGRPAPLIVDGRAYHRRHRARHRRR